MKGIASVQWEKEEVSPGEEARLLIETHVPFLERSAENDMLEPVSRHAAGEAIGAIRRQASEWRRWR